MATGGVQNVFITPDVIAKESLRLLKNNLVAVPLVYRDIEKTFAKVGDTISIRLPYRTKTAEGRTLVIQPLVDKKIPFTIDRQRHFGLQVDVRDRTLRIENFSERYLKSPVIQMANVVDESILSGGIEGGFWGNDTPIANLNIAALFTAKATMSTMGVPNDGLRRAVINPFDVAAVSQELSNKFNEKMVKEAIVKGYLGELAQFDMFESQNLGMHTTGAFSGSEAIDGVGQTGDTLNIKGMTASTGTIKKGDVFTIAGVYAINPQTYETTGLLQKFVVLGDVTADADGKAQISISPAINDGTLTTTDSEGNSISLAGYQNVTAAPADNAAMTFIGDASTTYKQSLLFHKDAIAFASPDLELPETASLKTRIRDSESGLSLALTGAYDVTNQRDIMRIDIIWGVKVIYPELIYRIWTNA